MPSHFQLIMRSGPTPGAAFTLEGEQITVGRDSTNEIVINDAECAVLEDVERRTDRGKNSIDLLESDPSAERLNH